MSKIYLAVPYTWNPAKSFEVANKVSAQLMESGHIVFSPVSHSHSIADFLHSDIRTNSEWWMTQDLPLVEWADEIKVVMIGEFGNDLIEKSKGVQMEIAHAVKHNKPITIFEYYE